MAYKRRKRVVRRSKVRPTRGKSNGRKSKAKPAKKRLAAARNSARNKRKQRRGKAATRKHAARKSRAPRIKQQRAKRVKKPRVFIGPKGDSYDTAFPNIRWSKGRVNGIATKLRKEAMYGYDTQDGRNVGQVISAMRKIVPKGPDSNGQLFASAEDKARAYDRITLWTVFRSDEGAHLVRPHVFISKKKPRSVEQWKFWLDNNIDEIQRTDVLKGIRDRTSQQFFIYKRLGWIGHARKFSGTAAVGKKWRPSKSSRKQSK
jgi:hypothetical protein